MILVMKAEVLKYLSEIGRRGGKASRRELSSEAARAMVRVREARRAFKKFATQCFWSYAPDTKITSEDVAWVAEQLMKNGDRTAWEVGARLSR